MEPHVTSKAGPAIPRARLRDAPRVIIDRPRALRTPASRFGGSIPYLTIRSRFLACMVIALLWVVVSTYLALPWIRDLGSMISMPLAIGVIGGIAIIPGYLNAFLVASLLLDRPRLLRSSAPGKDDQNWPPLTLIIAAFNEEILIEETLTYAVASDYPGRLNIIVADDGSTDTEAGIVDRFMVEEGEVSLLRCAHGGKAATLNAALATARTELMATIDADTLLAPGSLRRAVARLVSAPPGTAAVAGAVLVRNSRDNWLTRLQEWDYQLGIASIKRSQAVWQATLVSQGAFSVYRRTAVVEAGGWPDAIGEDIVLTWSMLDAGWTIGFEPTAIAFTHVPSRVRDFARQRSRWARGMIEGLRGFGPRLLWPPRMVSHGIAINCLFVWMDLCYTFAFLPGVVLALTGNFALVGPVTLAVIPLNLLISGLMYHLQRGVFDETHMSLRRNVLGFLLYSFAFQPMMSPVAVKGYFQEFFSRPRDW